MESERFQVDIYDYDKHTASSDAIRAFSATKVCDDVHRIYVELDIRDVSPREFMEGDDEMEIDLYPCDEDKLVVLRVKAREPTTFFFNYMGRGVFEFIAIRQDKHHKIVGGE